MSLLVVEDAHHNSQLVTKACKSIIGIGKMQLLLLLEQTTHTPTLPKVTQQI